ncbi:MAG: YdcF family protein [Mycoplasmatales bacterium]
MKKLLKGFKILVISGIGIYLLLLGVIYGYAYLNSEPDATNTDYIVVLGAKVNGDQPSKRLQGRLDYALKIATDQKIIVTGGQGSDEQYPEAEIMKKYLVEAGYNEKLIIVEDKATSTFENMLFSRDLIKNGSKIIVVSQEFHLFRVGLICLNLGMKCGLAPSNSIFKIEYGDDIRTILREPIAIIKSFIFDHEFLYDRNIKVG